MDTNRINLIGRFVRPAEIKNVGETNIANFSLAVNMRKKGDVSFFNCTAFGKLTEIISKYTDKGKQVAIDGYLKQDSWTDQKSGEKRSTVKIIVESFQLLGSKSDSQSSNPPPIKNDYTVEQQTNFDDDIPF